MLTMIPTEMARKSPRATLEFVLLGVAVCILSLLSWSSTITVSHDTQAPLRQWPLPNSIVQRHDLPVANDMPPQRPEPPSPFSQSSSSSSSLPLPVSPPAICPSWSPEFAHRFETMCAPWVGRLTEWAENVKRAGKEPVQYTCIIERRCNGLGDRFSGVFSVLEAALEQHRPARVLWDGLSEVLEPTCLMAETWEPQAKDRYSPACLFPTAQSHVVHQSYCGPVYHECGNGHQGVRVRNFIRACPSQGMCDNMYSKLTSTTPASSLRQVADDSNHQSDDSSVAGANDERPVALASGTAAHIFGCAMRSMFQLTQSFREIEVAWIHNKVSSIMTVNQVEELLKGYFTISVHLRLGDRAFKNDEADIEALWGQLSNTFKCAHSVETYVEEMGFNKGLPVRWIFSSDSQHLRKRVLSEFGEKIMMLDEVPKHVSKTKGQTSVTAHTMTEWYFLSLGDRLVMNRRSSTNLFNGRLSGFSKSFWTFQLKHLFYDANTCRLRTMHFDGSWKPANPACKKLSNELLAWRLPQPHRKPKEWEPLRHGALAQSSSSGSSSQSSDVYSEEALFGAVQHHAAVNDGHEALPGAQATSPSGSSSSSSSPIDGTTGSAQDYSSSSTKSSSADDDDDDDLFGAFASDLVEDDADSDDSGLESDEDGET
jgi:hypothetical protein